MMFSESNLVRNIFSKLAEISIIYTVQILPRTDKVATTIIKITSFFQDSVEVVVFDGDPETTTDLVKSYFRSRLEIFVTKH